MLLGPHADKSVLAQATARSNRNLKTEKLLPWKSDQEKAEKVCFSFSVLSVECRVCFPSCLGWPLIL